MVDVLGQFGIGIPELNVVNLYQPELIYAFTAGYQNLTTTRSQIDVRILIIVHLT